MRVVLDASAFLALLLDEPGKDYVDQALASAVISTVNLCEVLSRIARFGKPTDGVLEDIEATSMAIVPFEQAHAERAAALVPLTSALGLSLGDRACLALAWSLGLPALTADRAWGELPAAVGVEVRLIR